MKHKFKYDYKFFGLAIVYNVLCIYFGIQTFFYIENNLSELPWVIKILDRIDLADFLQTVITFHRLIHFIFINELIYWIIFSLLLLLIFLLDRLLHRWVRFHLIVLLVITLFILPCLAFPVLPLIIYLYLIINYPVAERVFVYILKYRFYRYFLVFLLSLPFMAILLPQYLLFFLYQEKPKLDLSNAVKKYVPACIPVFLVSVIMAGVVGYLFPDLPSVHKQRTLYSGILYDIKIDRSTDRLFVVDMNRSQLLVFNLYDSELSRTIDFPRGHMERIAFDEKSRQLYRCNNMTRRLLTYDLDTFALEQISRPIRRGRGHVSIGYAPPSKTILAVFEYGGYSAIFPTPAESEHLFQVYPCNHYIFYNSFRNSFLLSFWAGVPYFMEYSLTDNSLTKIDANKFQMEFELDTKRDLIYLTLPLKKELYAYDAHTMKLKKRIPTVLGARPLAYDDLHDLLIVGSLITGEVEIIDLENDTRIRKKTFAYYQRDIALDKKRRRAYISSVNGLYYLDY
ncbi:MAG TPA: hypothetical protein PKW95_03965 [bacterium]|nr:hypothetical protein [bacterium]